MSQSRQPEIEMCCCGRPLHYTNAAVDYATHEGVRKWGPTIDVQVGGADRAYKVPRHYIALHGLKARELDMLAWRYGWERVDA